jgi:hypothetical protein
VTVFSDAPSGCSESSDSVDKENIVEEVAADIVPSNAVRGEAIDLGKIEHGFRASPTHSIHQNPNLTIIDSM